MCHCRPNVRTPCCGPACCGNTHGCAFCRPRHDLARPVAEEITRLQVRLAVAERVVDLCLAFSCCTGNDAQQSPELVAALSAWVALEP